MVNVFSGYRKGALGTNGLTLFIKAYCVNIVYNIKHIYLNKHVFQLLLKQPACLFTIMKENEKTDVEESLHECR